MTFGCLQYACRPLSWCEKKRLQQLCMYEGSGGGSFKCRRIHAGSINAQALIIFSKKKNVWKYFCTKIKDKKHFCKYQGGLPVHEGTFFMQRYSKLVFATHCRSSEENVFSFQNDFPEFLLFSLKDLETWFMAIISEKYF